MYYKCAQALLLAVLVFFPKAAWADQDDQIIEQKINAMNLQFGLPPVSELEKTKPKITLNQTLVGLKAFAAGAKEKSARCQDAQKKVFGGKYVLTLDENGKACRIYDLSFPNLKAAFNHKKVTEVPIQKMASRDYINWIDGNYEAIEASQETYKKNFNARLAANQSWLSKLRFKRKPEYVAGSKPTSSDVGLPVSFKLSDLDVGAFQFDAQTRIDIQNLMAELKDLDGVNSEYLMTLLDRPQTMLESIKFEWNDAKKVFDIILTGEFLPIKPVALVEYQAQYKFAVEKQFRSILVSALSSLAGLIPEPLTQAAVGVLINDSFEQLEMAYSYQMLQLEDTLRSEPTEFSEQALNVLYGERQDLFGNFVMAYVQGKQFDFNALDKIGYKARYADEKARAITTAKMNSRLVLNKKCEMKLVHDSFGLCTRTNQGESVFSLMSERVAFNYTFGAPLLFNYKMPYRTTVLRGGAWLLSVGLRIFGLPLGGNVISNLNGLLKGYMMTGILDEALLRNHIYSKGIVMNQSADEQMMKWLYIQNLNPFLPKSATSENRVISANKQILGVQ